MMRAAKKGDVKMEEIILFVATALIHWATENYLNIHARAAKKVTIKYIVKWFYCTYGEGEDVLLDAGDAIWYLKSIMAGTKNAVDDLIDLLK